MCPWPPLATALKWIETRKTQPSLHILTCPVSLCSLTHFLFLFPSILLSQMSQRLKSTMQKSHNIPLVWITAANVCGVCIFPHCLRKHSQFPPKYKFGREFPLPVKTVIQLCAVFLSGSKKKVKSKTILSIHPPIQQKAQSCKKLYL